MYSSFVRIAALIAAASALALAPPAMGQGTATSPAKQTASREPTPPIGSAERNFMSEAAMDGMAEVQGGKFAATNAATDQVKSFAQRMVDDHGKANEELKRIAAIKGVKLPDDAGPAHRNDLARLVKLSGAEFDRAYIDHMVREHKVAASNFRKAAKKLKDPDVKQFAASTLPMVEEHRRMADRIAAALKERGAHQ